MRRIFFFVKFFNDEKYVNDFISGKLFANRLSHFKKIEENEYANRNDRHEGVFGWFQPDRGRLVFNGIDITGDLAGPVEMQREGPNHLNMFCIYAAHSGVLDPENLSSENIAVLKKQLEIPKDCLKLGKHAVVVTDLPKFIDRIETAAKSRSYRIARGLVKYYDPENFHGSVTDVEAIFRKRNEYRHQREYRFVIDTLTVGTDPITLDIGRYQ